MTIRLLVDSASVRGVEILVWWRQSAVTNWQEASINKRVRRRGRALSSTDRRSGAAVKKYEIWGADDGGKYGLLAYASLDEPVPTDTVLVRGRIREIEKVWRHHGGAQPVLRVGVAAGGEPVI